MEQVDIVMDKMRERCLVLRDLQHKIGTHI